MDTPVSHGHGAALDDATRRQNQAASPDASTWLSANAGSGKTRVLTDRVARLLLDGVAPQNILCLTYTKAAASEMQNRLFKRLGSWSMKPDAKLTAELYRLGVEEVRDPERLAEARRLFARAIETPGGLRIQTIHSFCASLLRRFPLEAGVTPGFQEMDERSAALLFREVLEELAVGPDVAAVDALAGHCSDTDVSELLRAIVSRRDSFGEGHGPDDISGWFDLPAGHDEARVLKETFDGGEKALFDRLRPAMEGSAGKTDRNHAERLRRFDWSAPGMDALETCMDIFLTKADARKPFSAKIGAEAIRDMLACQGYELGAGEYETVPVSDHQDFPGCVQEMRCGLEERVIRWRRRGEGHECVVDFTGGTKCMSAALALVARPWPGVRFSYVGGERRDKNRVGIVVAGSERVVSAINPWDTLGYQVVEEAVAAFDRHAFGWGVDRLQNALSHVDDRGSRKSELSALVAFMKGYNLWDRSEYGPAFDSFGQCAKHLNNLAAAIPGIPKDWFERHVDRAKDRLNELKEDSSRPTSALLEDLIANAARRREEGRHVDAVARLYRAIEATAQLRLSERFGIDTGKVSLEDIPGPMRDRLEAHAEDGKLKLALQDAYELLRLKKDPLGDCFVNLGWNSLPSPLAERNNSIAGHGFKAVSPQTTCKLWNGALSLAGITDRDVFRFPKFKLHDPTERRIG